MRKKPIIVFAVMLSAAGYNLEPVQGEEGRAHKEMHSHDRMDILGTNDKDSEKIADQKRGPDTGHEHRHQNWLAPSTDYTGFRSDRWADLGAVLRGQKIYRQQCSSCHGADGRGTGPLVAVLPHPPADLTNHFHTRSGNGDAYLFWRVSEGGTMEPFVSMGSAMPAFKSILSIEERWDVLAYVHTDFHLGLVDWRADSSAKQIETGAGQPHGH